MIRERLLVVGNGMAGIRAIEEVLARAPGRYDIAVFGAEPHLAYSRIMLSPMLAGEKRFDEIVTHDRAWYEANGIALHTGVRVTAIHRDARIVVTGDGRSFAYDRLILATGSEPAPLPVPGSELPGVMTFRNAGDVEAMLRQTRDGARAVVIGGGLLGLEAAYHCRASDATSHGASARPRSSLSATARTRSTRYRGCLFRKDGGHFGQAAGQRCGTRRRSPSSR